MKALWVYVEPAFARPALGPARRQGDPGLCGSHQQWAGDPAAAATRVACPRGGGGGCSVPERRSGPGRGGGELMGFAQGGFLQGRAPVRTGALSRAPVLPQVWRISLQGPCYMTLLMVAFGLFWGHFLQIRPTQSVFISTCLSLSSTPLVSKFLVGGTRSDKEGR